MGLFGFIADKVVEERESPINGKIQVIKKGKDYRIEVGGLLQSGGIVKKIWQAGLKKVNQEVRKCLILGLGGGTAARLILRRWPEAKITGVEIDPAMIELGKKYFGIKEIPNLEIIQAEAIGWLKRAVGDFGEFGDFGEKKYNLILVDLYVGEEFPKKAEGDEFLRSLRKLLAAGGTIIFNRLFWGEKKKEVEKFVKKLEKHFSKISLKRTPCNLLIFCSF